MTFAREFSLPDTLYFYSHSKFDHFQFYSVRVIIYFVCMYLNRNEVYPALQPHR